MPGSVTSPVNQSLQLDETVGICAAQILGDTTHLALIHNRHLWCVSSPRAGFRLVLHGLGTEMLHAVLVQHKRAASSGAREKPGFGLQSLGRGQGGRVTALLDIHVERLPLDAGLRDQGGGFLLIYFAVGGLTHLLVTRVFLPGAWASPRARSRRGSSGARSASRRSRSRFRRLRRPHGDRRARGVWIGKTVQSPARAPSAVTTP